MPTVGPYSPCMRHSQLRATSATSRLGHITAQACSRLSLIRVATRSFPLIVAMSHRQTSDPSRRTTPTTPPRACWNGSRKYPGPNLAKLTAIESTTADVDPTELNADLCFIDAEHTDNAALQDARFCLRVIRGQGVIVFHDRTLVADGIQRFLGELSRYRAYPLAHELFVVEVGMSSLFVGSTGQGPASAPSVGRRGPTSRDGTRASARANGAALAIAVRTDCPDARSAPPQQTPNCAIDASVERLVRGPHLRERRGFYERMHRSFVDGGFSPDAFVWLTDSKDDPYTAITRICQESTARYPILCHQDIVADQGAGAEELLTALQELDGIDPHWAVAGNAGVMRSGRLLLRVVDKHGGSTGESLPLPVVSLDESSSCSTPGIRRGARQVYLTFTYTAQTCVSTRSPPEALPT